jgi:hypothetical protein
VLPSVPETLKRTGLHSGRREYSVFGKPESILSGVEKSRSCASPRGGVFGKARNRPAGRGRADAELCGNLGLGRACAPQAGYFRDIHGNLWPSQLLPLGPSVLQAGAYALTKMQHYAQIPLPN